MLFINYNSLIVSKYFKEPLSGLPAINYDSDVIVNTVRRETRRFPRIDGTTLNNSITYARAIIDKLNTLESNLANAGIELQAQSPAEKQFWNSNPSTDAFERSIDAIVAGKASLYLRDLKCRRYVSIINQDIFQQFFSSLIVKIFDTSLYNLYRFCNIINT